MKKAIVTGGAAGIGHALVEGLTNNGFQVYSIDLNEPIEKIDKATYIHLDINDINRYKEAFNHIGKVDLLINNAAEQIESPFLEQDIKQISKVLNTNLISTIALTHYILKHHFNPNAQIINVSSVHGTIPRKNKIAYDVSKAGIEMFTKALALELAPTHRVNAIAIGATITPMNNNFMDKNKMEESRNKVPLQHVFTAPEIAQAIIAFTHDTFKYMTGSIIIYDAGRSLTR